MSRLGSELLPGARRSGPVPWLIAATCFLTVIAAAGALALAHAARTLDEAAAGRLTVQVVDADPAARDASAARVVARLSRLPGVRVVKPVGRDEMVRLLAPYLGGSGVADLPLPALIDVTLAPGAAAAPVAAALAGVPHAELQPGGASLAGLARLIAALRSLAAAIMLIAVTATMLVAMLAARATLETHEPTLRTLHGLGASDGDLATLIQRRTVRDALIGGGIGLAGASVAILAIGARLAGLDAGIAAGTRLGLGGWLLLAAIPLALAVLATVAARLAVLDALGRAS